MTHHHSDDITKNEKDPTHVVDGLTDAEKLMPELRTLAYCQQRAFEKGYKEDFRAVPGGLQCIKTERIYKPEQIQIADYYRFEGITDPADMSVLYVIETDDGTKGTLVDAYGTYSDADVAKVIIAIDAIAKKNTTKNGKA